MTYETVLYEKNVAIGHRIRFFRRRKNLSQKDLADKLRVTYQQFQKYETGQNRISAASLELVAEILEVPVEVFFYYGIEDAEFPDQCELTLVHSYKNIDSDTLKEHLLQTAMLFARVTGVKKY